MKQNIYTLITYIPGEEGWHDRCGDYNSGKESELKIQYFTDTKSAGDAMGENKFNNEDTEFTILINGLNEDEYHDFLSKEELLYIDEESDLIRDISDKKYEELKKIQIQKDTAIKLKKEQEDSLKKQKERERFEQIERAQLAQLQAKYGN
jgi:hypothetical protein